MFFRYVVLAACFVCSNLTAEFKFEEYVANNAKDFINDLCTEFPPSTEAMP